MLKDRDQLTEELREAVMTCDFSALIDSIPLGIRLHGLTEVLRIKQQLKLNESEQERKVRLTIRAANYYRSGVDALAVETLKELIK